MATAKQKSAARRNIKKAQAARRAKIGGATPKPKGATRRLTRGELST